MYSRHSYCGTETGSACCSKQSRQTDLAQYGVGIALYFQFLKHIVWMFFIVSLMSVPAYVFFYSGNSSKLEATNIKNVLTAFSLGNIGQCKEPVFLMVLSLAQYACNNA